MKKHDPARRTATVWLTGALAGCVNLDPVAGANRVLSTTYDQRITDEAVRRDWAAIDALRAHIARARGAGAFAYAVARAEAMLNFAVDEYEENDRTGVLEVALNDALRVVRAGESGQRVAAVDWSLPTWPGITVVRKDLVDMVQRAKADPVVLNCAGVPIARLEAALVELGHEQYEADVGLNEPDHAKPYEPMVDALADDLRRALTACAPLQPLGFDAAQGPLVPALKRLRLHTLFRFDEYEPQHMLSPGRTELDAFGIDMALQRDSWRSMVVTGHTDRLGGHAYNLTLSQRRAQTVRAYLVQHYRLPPERIQIAGLASTKPLVYCEGPDDERLRQCLQPNRRVEIEVFR
jgi:OmpA-OmpF porin, OOP family